jgi:tetratricopeptide (TPR) repeat protein
VTLPFGSFVALAFVAATNLSGSWTDSSAPQGTAIAATDARQAEHHLRGSDGLARVYDAILDARFDDVEAEVQRACPPAPAEACQLLRVTATWWHIQIDPDNRTMDQNFLSSINSAIASTEAWVARDPKDAEAWFYLGAAYAMRVQFRVLRSEKIAAARDGKRIKQALERAVQLDPDLDDAYFGVGMYQYYADVAPAAARFLRWLLLLPGGDKEQGLARMLRAQASGELLRGEADFQLHIIYLWYEKRSDTAIALLKDLQANYPRNPLFPLLVGDIQEVYLHDRSAALDTYQSVLAAAETGRVNLAPLAEARARIGVARQLDELAETDRAIDQLKNVLEDRPIAPYSARALAALRLGAAYDRMGQPELATTAYRSAIASAPSDDPLGIVDLANAAIRHRPDPRVGEAYRLSIEGWRALQHSESAQAQSLLTRSLQLKGDDPVAQYRYGRVLIAIGDDAGALAAFERTQRLAASCPPTILASSFLDSGRLHERTGHRDRAAVMYRSAASVFGAAAETRTTAQRLLARLSMSRSITPSARRSH